MTHDKTQVADRSQPFHAYLPPEQLVLDKSHRAHLVARVLLPCHVARELSCGIPLAGICLTDDVP